MNCIVRLKHRRKRVRQWLIIKAKHKNSSLEHFNLTNNGFVWSRKPDRVHILEWPSFAEEEYY